MGNSPLVGNGGIARWGISCICFHPQKIDSISKSNTLHPNVDLLYKSQPFTDCFNNKNNQYMRYCMSCLGKSDNTAGLGMSQISKRKMNHCMQQTQSCAVSPWCNRCVTELPLLSFYTCIYSYGYFI